MLLHFFCTLQTRSMMSQCLCGTINIFATIDHNMIIFFNNCKVFTKLLYLKSNLCAHFSTDFHNYFKPIPIMYDMYF